MFHANGPLCEDRDAPKTRSGLMGLFEELHTEHGDEEGKQVAATTGWLLPWEVQLTVANERLKLQLTLEEEHWNKS